MRENISTIFAILIGVVILIIFPLFSIMSRQDSISYNRVLTLTTEFVDSVRAKGYFTEQEYSDYLVKLANTNNTYNVQMEYHKKILINDVNNISEEPVYVEDTLVYYNKDINRMMLQNNGNMFFNENDEFYIKIYNTNITTASLLYNYFARVSIPPKVINIGYGGKVSHITGVEYTKTDFSNSYSPYIKLGDVVNLNGEKNEVCYDSNAGTYDIKTCIRLFNLSEPKNQTITVPFEMYNFENIIKYSTNGNRDIRKISNLQEFEDNKDYIEDAIQNLVTLRGIEVEDEEQQYVVEILDIKYENSIIKGTIKISNIHMTKGVSTRSSNVVIGQGLGTGPTGIVAAEARTHEILFVSIVVNPEFQLLGPFTTQEISSTAKSVFNPKQTAYFKVKLIDYTSEISLDTVNLRDLDEDRILDKTEYTINFIEEIADKEYWIKISYYSLYDKNFTLEITTQKPVENAVNEGDVVEVVTASNPFKYKSVDWSEFEQSFEVIGSQFRLSSFYVKIDAYGSIDEHIFNHNTNDTEKFISEVKEKLNIQMEYASNANPGYALNYYYEIGEESIKKETYHYFSGGSHSVYSIFIPVSVTMKLSSTKEPIKGQCDVILTMNTIYNTQATSQKTKADIRGIKVPDGFTYREEDIDNIYITDKATNREFKWVWSSEYLLTLYTRDEDKRVAEKEYFNALLDSVNKYYGYYLSVEPIMMTYNDKGLSGNEQNSDYWQQAWDNSVQMYENHEEIVSHMAYGQQAQNVNIIGTIFRWVANGSGERYYCINRRGNYQTWDDSYVTGYSLSLYLK